MKASSCIKDKRRKTQETFSFPILSQNRRYFSESANFVRRFMIIIDSESVSYVCRLYVHTYSFLFYHHFYPVDARTMLNYDEYIAAVNALRESPEYAPENITFVKKMTLFVFDNYVYLLIALTIIVTILLGISLYSAYMLYKESQKEVF